jgi:tetratricopeptide (TPR) repeat protein
MTDHTENPTLSEFTPALVGFRAEEFLTLTETLLAFPIEHDQARLDAAPFRLDRPEPLPEKPLPPLPPRWYPRPDPVVGEAARERLKPPPRPAIFEGRAQELARLLRPLLSGHAVRVCGESGIGKTTLLATVASHERTRQRFRRIWWFDAPDQVEQTLALALNLPHVIGEPDPVKRWNWLAGQVDDHTLLIIDNAPPGDPLVEHLISRTPNVLVAVETVPELPNPDEPLPEDPEGVVTLRTLEDAAAVDALALHAGIEDTRRLRGPLLTIATALGHHPYALMLAGALIRRDGLSLDELQELLALESPVGAPLGVPRAEQAPPLQDESENDESDDDTAALERHLASLNRALDVSIEALPRDYRRLFDAFGAFPPGGAPFDGLHTIARIGNPLATRRGLILLAEYGLIRRDHRDPDQYVMHPFAYAHTSAHDDDDTTGDGKIIRKVQAWALRYARAHQDDPAALYHAGASLRHALDAGEENAALGEALRPFLCETVPGGLALMGGQPPELTGLRAEAANLTQYGIELTDQNAFYAAEGALNRALEIRQAHDSPHANAETLVAVGRLYDRVGRLGEAADALVKAAELVYRLDAEASLSVTRRGLARVYRHMGRLNDALGVLDDAPEAHFERAAILRAQGNYAAAVEEMKLSGEDAPYARAETFVLAGRYADALDALTGQDDPNSALLRAQIYHLQGNIEQAIQGYHAALECCMEHEADSVRAKALRGLGAAQASGGDYEAARETLEAALAIHRAEESPDPVRVGRTLRLLAAVHFAAGDTETAITAARDALVQLRQVNAAADIADASRTLGRALWAMGDYQGALEAFSDEVEQAQSLPERDDALIGIALHHLADAYRQRDELERAIANYRRALTHKKPADDLESYLMTQFALHRALLEAGRLTPALDVSQEIIDQLARRPDFDLQFYGYAQTLRARNQQAIQRPIRARQSLDEWTKVLAARAGEAADDPRPGLGVLALGLAARSLLVEDRPALALSAADREQEIAAAHYSGTLAAWAAIRDTGEAYIALEQHEETILTLDPLLDEAVRESSAATYALAHELTGRAYWKLGDHAAALSHLGTAFDHEPDDHLKGLIRETIATIQLETGQPAEAVDSLRAALPLLDREEHPDAAARVLTTTAHTLGGLNRYAEAITVYEDALSALRAVEGVSPTHTADVLRSLGRTHEAQGQPSEAARAYRRALNLLEKADAPRQSRDILYLLARVTAAMGDQSAVQLYEQTREATEQWGTVEELGRVLCELANVHRDGGRLTPAIQNYQAALSHQPAPLLARDRIDTLRNMGRAYAQMERYDEARDAWTEALDLSHDLPDSSPTEIGLTHHAIAEAYRSQGQFAEAELSYREALHHLGPNSIPAAASWRALGEAIHAEGRPADAVEMFQRALEIEKAQPQQANARIVHTLQRLAGAQEDAGNLDAAITRHHEALVYTDRRLQPVAYADTLRTLGRLYEVHRNYPQALKALNEALDIEGQHVPHSEERITATLQAVAETYRASGDLEKAAETYQKVTVYVNFARRVSDDLKETLSELDRRRGTLQAAQQSLALLDRSDSASVRDRALLYALIAYAHAQLNQPQDSADTINSLLDLLIAHREELSPADANGDTRALAWLASAAQADENEDLDTAQFACGSALETVRDNHLRWVIEQMARSLG